MLSLEQVQLLETRVAKAIEYVQRVNDENAALSSEKAALSAEKASLLSKLESNQKRLDELELLVMRFKEDQGRIEDGIIAALDRLSQFEEAFESSLSEKEKTGVKKNPVKKEDTAKKEEATEQKKTDKPKEDFELDADLSDTEIESKDIELDIF